MALIDLPALPGNQEYSVTPVRAGGIIRAPLGGPAQQVNRLGDRSRVRFTLPPLPASDLANEWIAKLKRGLNQGVRHRFPQFGANPEPLGLPVVDGAGQTGTVLNLRGLHPFARIGFNRALSITVGARSFAYFAADYLAADGDGKLALPLDVMLRQSPADGAVVNFAAPVIEGFLVDDQWSWTLPRARLVGLQFEIEEYE